MFKHNALHILSRSARSRSINGAVNMRTIWSLFPSWGSPLAAFHIIFGVKPVLESKGLKGFRCLSQARVRTLHEAPTSVNLLPTTPFSFSAKYLHKYKESGIITEGSTMMMRVPILAQHDHALRPPHDFW